MYPDYDQVCIYEFDSLKYSKRLLLEIAPQRKNVFIF